MTRAIALSGVPADTAPPRPRSPLELEAYVALGRIVKGRCCAGVEMHVTLRDGVRVTIECWTEPQTWHKDEILAECDRLGIDAAQVHVVHGSGLASTTVDAWRVGPPTAESAVALEARVRSMLLCGPQLKRPFLFLADGNVLIECDSPLLPWSRKALRDCVDWQRIDRARVTVVEPGAGAWSMDSTRVPVHDRGGAGIP